MQACLQLIRQLCDSSAVPWANHGRCLDQEVVDRDFDALLGQALVQLRPGGQQPVHAALHREVVVGDGCLALQQPLGRHLANVGVGLVCPLALTVSPLQMTRRCFS